MRVIFLILAILSIVHQNSKYSETHHVCRFLGFKWNIQNLLSSKFLNHWDLLLCKFTSKTSVLNVVFSKYWPKHCIFVRFLGYFSISFRNQIRKLRSGMHLPTNVFEKFSLAFFLKYRFFASYGCSNHEMLAKKGHNTLTLEPY